MATASRKDAHLRIAAGPGVTHAGTTGLESVRLRHRALPERDLEDVRLDRRLLGRELAAPLVISAMTGGTPEARTVNHVLAAAAAARGIGMTLGSGRSLLADPSLVETYRGDARPPLLLANIGAVQLRAGVAERLVGLLGADGLSIHLNPLQEAVQPEGEPRFAGVAERIGAAVREIAPLPVAVKEVGFGIDPADVALLVRAGVAAVDVAGAGGTNWALVEGRRDEHARELAAAFADWGQPTRASLEAARAAAPDLTIVASGGIGSGVDAAKCLALGADAAAIARPLLRAAQEGRAGEAIDVVVRQLRIATWLAGAAHASELGPEHLL